MSKFEEKQLRTILLDIYQSEGDDARGIFLSQTGEILNLKIPGYYKPDSSHRRDLKRGVVEVEYFAAPSNPNLGRVKQAYTIYPIDEYDETTKLLQRLLNKNTDLSPEIFEATENIVVNIDKQHIVFNYVVWLINKVSEYHTGHPLTMSKCVRCGTTENIHTLSLHDGGLLCSSCSYGEPHTKFTEELLVKLIKLYYAEGQYATMAINFKPEEEEMVKQLYMSYLNTSLGL